MNMQALLLLVLGAVSLMAQSPLPPPAEKKVDFTRDVDPILSKRCYMCHGTEVAMNGYSLWNRKDAVRGGYSGVPVIVAGDSANSRLIRMVAGLEENLVMPPAGGRLTAEEIGILRAWIDQGVRWGPGREEAEKKPTQEWLEMDYGPVISASITVRQPADPRADKTPKDNVAYKGHAIALTPKKDATVLFDTELMRYAAGWRGGFLVLTGTRFDWKHGPHPYADGVPVFETPVAPGWAKSGDFTDPRPSGFGPLPATWAKYRGRYVHGEKTVLAYTVGGTEILDMPGYEGSAFTRTLEVGPNREALVTVIANGDVPVHAIGAKVERVAGQVRLRIPSSSTTRTVQVAIGGKVAEEPASLKSLTRGGPARFPEVLTTRGKLGTGSGPWVVDEIALPENNPWKSWMRPGDFAFFDDDRAVVTTWSGDVWIVSGVDDDLGELRWKRYATGFNQPLGTEVVDGVVYILDRNQITRLHDLNGDGEADFYENFNNDFEATHHFHEFTFDLDRGQDGNFYFAKAARHALPAKVKDHGVIFKLDPAGKRLETVCRGFRVPNGVAVSPEGFITTSDQEGHWIPSTPIAWCTPGSYHGYAWGGGVDPARVHDYDPPLTYLPISVDNSGAGQAWVPDDRWGPLKGHLIHSSYGRGTLFVVLIERAGGQIQGGAFELPLTIDTGVMRPDFRKRDGQLYVCGLRGWGTKRKAVGGFYRVRYTGKPIHVPVEMHVNTTDGVAITFSQALDAETATEPSKYFARRWNYKRTSRYGSDLFKLNGEQGTDTMRVTSARLSDDRKTVFLGVENLVEVQQMQIGFDLRSADGAPVNGEIFHTVNKLTPERGERVLAGF